MPTNYKGDAGTIRALNVHINLARATDSLFARLSPQLERDGLTTGQFGVLEALLHLGPMCQHTLGQKLLRSGGNVTLVVDNLEKRGWVRRERLVSDRRMVMIHLTPVGRELIAKVFPKHAKAVRKEMSALNPAEQETLRRLARKLGLGGEKLRRQRRKKEKEDDTSSTK
jgi:MarR family transcriptional regulator, 2-MHQ and catechol-resistance regulon repressor